LAQSLSQEYGRAITIVAPLDRHVLFVSPHGAALESVLQAIATATRAEVRRTAGGYILRPEERRRAKDKREIIAERADFLGAAITKSAKLRTSQLSGLGLAEAVGEAVKAEAQAWDAFLRGNTKSLSLGQSKRLMPAQELLEKLVENFGPSRLAELAFDGPAVVETHPRARATRLVGADDMVARYEQEISGLRARVPDAETIKAIETVEGVLPGYLGVWQKGAGVVADLRLRAVATGPSMIITLELFDKSGVRLDGAEFDSGEKSLAYGGLPAAVPHAAAQSGDRLALSDLGAALEPASKRRDPLALAQWLAGKSHSDPLELLFAAPLRKWASEHPSQVVAVDLDDGCWMYGVDATKDGLIDALALKTMMSSWGGYEESASPGSFTFAPRYYFDSERHFLDRHVLQKYAAGWIKGEDPFWLKAEFYCGARGKLSPLAQDLLGLLVDQKRPIKNQVQSEALFSLLGRLHLDLWDSMLGGTSVMINDSTATPEPSQLVDEDRVSPSRPIGLPDLLRHLGELFGSGEPESVKARLEVAPAIFFREQAQLGQPMPWRPLGELVSMAPLRYVDRPYPHYIPDRDGFEGRIKIALVAGRARLIRLFFPRGCSLDVPLEPEVGNDAPTVKFQDLPAELRDQLWKAATEAALARFKREVKKG
jgi:hypothetical protein